MPIYALWMANTYSCFFRIQGKAKYAAWKKVADEGISAEEAQKRYVDFIEKLKEKYGYDESKQPEQVGGN